MIANQNPNNSCDKGIKLGFPAFSVIIAFTIFMIVGIAITPLISLRLEPSGFLNSITINFNWQKASAEMVEHEVTARLEGALATLKGVKKISSSSYTGGGYVRVDLDEHSSVNQIRYEAAILIRQIYSKLPIGVTYPVIRVNQPLGQGNKSVLSYTINGRGNLSEIQRYAERNIVPTLAQLNGVYDIRIYGGNQYNWELQYNSSDLVRYRIFPDEMVSAIDKYFKEYELGRVHVDNYLSGDSEYRYLKLRARRTDSIPWGSIPVKKIGGGIVYLGDIAKAKYVEQKPGSYYRINGLNAINLIVYAAEGTNYISLAGEIKRQMEQLKKSLPGDYSIVLSYDSSEHLKKELDKIIWRSLCTLAILLLFVFIVSRQLNYLLLILISLVANLLLAFILYYCLKLEINLYSLAAITVSMGMITDNSIVVIDHVRHKNNLKVFLAVTGSTLTTIGAVCIIFFLDEQQKVNLLDFAWVMIVNLGISLLVALFLIPALLEKIPLPQQRLSLMIRRKRKVVKWNRFYSLFISFNCRFRIYYIIVLILIFGLPFFMLPAKIEQKDFWGAKMYNATFGSSFYNENIRFGAEKWLGGTLRLFISQPGRFDYGNNSHERTRLTVNISMPKGASLAQMNRIAVDFENYLSQFKEIEKFQCKVNSGQSASIDILFHEEYDEGVFPDFLKSELETKAIYTGLADFTISGVGQGFNNQVNTQNANYSIVLQGFNYQELRNWAEQVKDILSENPRVDKISIGTERDWSGRKLDDEFVFRIDDNDQLLVNNVSPRNMQAAFNDFSADKRPAGSIFYRGNYIPVVLVPTKPTSTIWQVMNEPVQADSGAYIRLNGFASVDKEKVEDKIFRENQQYQLVVNYNFIGDHFFATMLSDRVINRIKVNLPFGYTIESATVNFWRGSEKKLAWTIFLTIAIVFMVCAVLLNSISQPLAVIAMIPISFIGVFITSYFFDYRFDEGGYAAFIILCGVVVNAALFILNDYNNLLKDQGHKDKLTLFVKSYNSKIIPVILSTVSMIIGLIPFIIYSKNDVFWYALAISTIGGLVFSMIAVLVFLPMFLKGIGKKSRKFKLIKNRL
ncbi:acriflavin resistance protein [Pseudopedobacter saltans DSM 12145]|uniref:Acriflavin resistance protein n=1 Tax=Pseudopedobacter saltans (strain ATCC 51119 / DSM 12145 / JCM 21818 / CCUG 39354 / LMG 10337 / NBRC 100064 / NCIMB 13643) TaxID=762903 RepID=F0S4B0_PSESL|nr:efflux RND transporter permease subunit [Pseudopedobacter saltans]ADY50867.1 acriflavin resistance protein [Pseudopedobacter saltans DSM 12145]